MTRRAYSGPPMSTPEGHKGLTRRLEAKGTVRRLPLAEVRWLKEKR